VTGTAKDRWNLTGAFFLLFSGKEKEVIAMERGGNKIVNFIFEAKGVNDGSKPVASVDDAAKERFIKDKYRVRKFYSPEGYANIKEEVGNNTSCVSQESKPRMGRQSSMPTVRSLRVVPAIGDEDTGILEKTEAPFVAPDVWKNMEAFAQWDAFDASTSPVKDQLSITWHPQSVDKVKDADNHVQDCSKRNTEGKSRTSKSQPKTDSIGTNSWHHPKRAVREKPRKRSIGFNDGTSSPSTDALNMPTETSKISLKKSPSNQSISKGSNHSASIETPSKSSVESTGSHSLSKSSNYSPATTSTGTSSHSRSRSSSRHRKKRSSSKPRKKKNVPSTPDPDLTDEKPSPDEVAMEKATKAELIGRLAGCQDGDAKDVGARLLEYIDSVQKSQAAADREEAKTPPLQRSVSSNAAIQTEKSTRRAVLRRDKSLGTKTPVQRTKSNMEIKRKPLQRPASATVELMKTPLQQTRTTDAKKPMVGRTKGLDVKRTVPRCHSMELCDDKKAMWTASADASQQRRPIAPAGDGSQKRVVLTRAMSISHLTTTKEGKTTQAENAASQQRRPIAPAGDGSQKRVVLTRAMSISHLTTTKEGQTTQAENAAPADDPFGVPRKGDFNLSGKSK
jgi:hypothetical protein